MARTYVSHVSSPIVVGHNAVNRVAPCWSFMCLILCGREMLSASVTLVVVTSFIMFSLRSAAEVGSVVLQLTLSALLCPLLPALLVCEHVPSRGK